MQKRDKQLRCFFKVSRHVLCAVSALFVAPYAPANAQVVVNTISTVSFGSLDFGNTYSARIQLGTNGDLNVVGSGIIANGGEAAGHIRITSPDTGIIDIKCTTTAAMHGQGATNIAMESIELSVNIGRAFGTASACDGLNPGDNVAVSIDMDALPDPDVYIGGEVVIPTQIFLPSDKIYSTTGTGSPIVLSIVVQ